MKLTTFLFLVAAFQVFATGNYAQDKKLNFNLGEATVAQVLEKIENQSEFYFLFNQKLVDVDRKIQMNIKNKRINEVLDQIFDGTGIDYVVMNRQIVLSPGRYLSDMKGLQPVTISGTVTDAQTGKPLPGVNIVVEGVTRGTTTDMNGQYSIEAEPDATLVFSFVGYQKKKVKIQGRQQVNVALESTIQELDEVMVVAYGETKRATFTGSASAVSEEQLSKLPLSNFTEALSVNTTGVDVYSTGQPGAMPYVRIRGIGSMNASEYPLYVIDGVPVSMSDIGQLGSSSFNPMASLNPDDIESMTVLKDAAAASLYGSRAANGVIVIKTKKGTEGETQYSVNVQRGVSDQLYSADVVNKDEFAEIWSTMEMHYLMYEDAPADTDPYQYIKDSYADQSLYNTYLEQARDRFNDRFRIEGDYYDFWGDGYDKYPDTDWMDEVSRLAITDKADLSASGGQDGLTYYASGEYFNEKSRIKNASLKRYGGRLNVSSKPEGKRIWFGVNLNLSYTDQSSPQTGLWYANPIRAANQIPPVVPVRNEDGSFNRSFPYNVLSNYNPVEIMANADFANTLHREMGTGWVQYNINKDLYFKSILGYDRQVRHEVRWYPPGIAFGRAANGVKYENDNMRRRITSSNTLQYSKTFNEVHNISALIGGEAEQTYTRTIETSAKEYQTEYTPVLSAASVIRYLNGNHYSFALLSAIGKLEYNYKDKYYAALSYRKDGASHFAKQSRWGDFYSVSGSWRISNESFLNNLSWLDDAKIRASYGINGTLPSTVFAYIGNYAFGNDYNDQSGAAVRNVENPNLSWEKSHNYNVGAEAKVLKGRIFASLEYFNRLSDDLLLDKELSRVSGYTDATVNLGAMRNKGFELTINARPFHSRDFAWDVNLNLSTLTNTIEKLPTDNVVSRQIDREGYTEQSWYLPEWAGVDKETGKPMWYHIDEETGEKTRTNDIDEATRQIFGNRYPHYKGGLNSSLVYKGLELSFSFSFGWDFNVFDYAGARYLQDDGDYRSRTKGKTMIDNWTPNNTNSDNPLIIAGRDNGSYYSTRYLYKGDYLKMKSIRLSYNLPSLVTDFIGIKGARAFIQGKNLFIATHMPDFDPEVLISGKRYIYTYPTQRTITAGINLDF